MNEAMPYADIVILALIAGFVLLRLRGVLGHKIGHDSPGLLRKPTETSARRRPDGEPQAAARQQQREEREKKLMEAVKDDAVAAGITQIKAADGSFNVQEFLDGGKIAFEMVFDAYAKADRAGLKFLLAPDIFEEFDRELERRERGETHTETTLVSVISHEIVRAELDKNVTRIALRFLTEQINLVRDGKGTVVEGDPSRVDRVEDEWVFERDVTSRNPNWKIIQT